MKLPSALNRTLAITLLASTCLLTIAPAAQAGRGSRRSKSVAHSRWDGNGRRVIVRDSGAAPLVAGLIGGFLLGTVVSNAQAAPVVTHEHHYVSAPRYRYFDPYCDEWFVSLSMCREHSWNDRHPAVVQVFDDRGGSCVRTMRWSNGSWCDVDDRDWRDRDYDRDWRD